MLSANMIKKVLVVAQIEIYCLLFRLFKIKQTN